MNADFLSDREQIGGVNEKFEAVDGDFHLVVDAFEDQVRHTSMDCAFLRFYEVDVLRALILGDQEVIPDGVGILLRGGPQS